MVEGVLALLVAAEAVASATSATNGINLVDEDDAWGFLLGLLEKVSHTAGSHAHKHLHKVGTRHGEEGHTGFASHSLGQQGLACAWRAYQESTLGYLTAQLGVFLGMAEKFHNLLELLFGAIQTCHVVERYVHLGVFAHLFGLRLTNVEWVGTATLT